MAVALVTHIEANAAIPTSPSSGSQTIGAASTLLLVAIDWGVSSGSLPTQGAVTWAGTSMTQRSARTSSDNLTSTYLYGLINPATGTQTLSISFTTNGGAQLSLYFGVVTFSGTDTTSLNNAVPTADILSDASTPSGTVYPTTAFSVNTANGDAVFAVMNCTGVQFTTMNIGTLLDTDGALQGNFTDGYRLATGGPTTIQFGSGSSGSPACGIAAHIQQPVASTPTWGLDQIFQPPPRNRQSNRAAAIMRGDEGNELPEIRWFNTGWEVQPPQPPHPRPEKVGALFGGDQGNEFTEIRWFNTGWEIQPPQPPHPRPEKGGTLFGGDSGIEFTEIRWFNTGWEIQPVQPPHPRPEKFATLIGGDVGTEFPEIRWFNTGWEIQPVQPRAYRAPATGIFGGDQGSQAILINWFNTGWEIQPPQPPHPRPERAGAITPKDDGTEFTFVNWYNSGWEIAPVQPPHPRPERSGAITSISNIEAVFVSPVVTVVPAGWEIPFVVLKTQPTISQKVVGAKGRSDFALFVNWQNAGWEIQPPQPPHPKPEKSGAIMPSEPGIEAVFIPPIVTVVPAGWEVQPFQPPHPRPERAGAIFGPVNIEATFTPFFALGWEIQPVQPPHQRLEERFAAIVQKDDGNEIPFINWRNIGWEIAPHQPRAYRASTGGIMPSDQGTEFTQVVWFNYGWEIPSPQPPHPRPERSGAISPRDEGIGLPFVPPPAVAPAGWEVLSVQPPHPRPERSGAIARSDDGTEFTFTNWLNFNWQIQPVQPPHPRPEIRSGAFVRVDEGIETILINWLVDGWQVQPVQPPHPRPEKAGAIMAGDTGTEAPFVFVPLPVTWAPDINNFVPVRPRRFGAGALPIIFENFPFFPPPPPPPIPPIPPGFVAQKVISVNVAPLLPIFPSVLFGEPILPSIVNVGEPFALLVSPAETLSPNATYTLFVTKPDGTRYQATSSLAAFQNNAFQNNAFEGLIPQVYLANVDSNVRQGLFPAQSYVALIIPGSFVDQHGYWSVALQSGSFTSQPQKFYIGPPTVLT